MDLIVNGSHYSVDVPDHMPLLWVVRDVLGLTGTKFGCGIAQCGACTVHLDGRAQKSCVLPVKAVAGISFEDAVADRQAASDDHNRRETALYAQSLERKALARN